MDGLSQDAYYWQFIHHLAIKEKMRVFQVSSDEKEIWLEKENSKETTVLRIIRLDLGWSNYIGKDIERLAIEGDRVRKLLGTRHLNILNVYISNYTPIGSYEEYLEKVYMTKRNRIKIRSFIIATEEEALGTSKIEEVLVTNFPTYSSDIENHNFRREVVALSDKRIKKEQALFTFGKPYFTYIILVSLIILFGLMEYFGDSTSLLTLVDFGAKYDPLIIEGEWWRFFSAIFLHIGFLHLFMNSLALYYLGSAVERIYGTTRFVYIYIIAGLFGSISSFAFNSQVSAGASGAIFGCFGALLYFGVVYRKLFFRTMGTNVIVILIINLTLGFLIPMIDNGAHIGGLVGGFLASSFLHLPNHKTMRRQILALIVTVCSLSGLLLYGFQTSSNDDTIHLLNVQIAQEHLQKGDVDQAYPLLKEAVTNEVDLVEANFLLAYTEAKLGLLEDAQKNLLITIEKQPFLHEAHFNLSLVYYELRQYNDALSSVKKALELDPENADYFQLKETIEKQLSQIGMKS